MREISRSGSIPPADRRRDTTSRARAVESGARTVVLAHLSSENNTPARARDVVSRRLSAGGIDPERDISLTVAPRKECGPVFRLERGRDMASFPLQEGAALC